MAAEIDLKSGDRNLPQPPELAGGAGYTFEDLVAARYLAALLCENVAPGIDHETVIAVAVQQRQFGEPLDDVIVDFRRQDTRTGRVSLQVKRSLVISSAATNTDFREIIRDSLSHAEQSRLSRRYRPLWERDGLDCRRHISNADYIMRTCPRQRDCRALRGPLRRGRQRKC
jgi:hypothetical protein